MTDLEKAAERVKVASEALAAVQVAAVQDRKLSHDRHTNGHYTKALQELEAIVNSNKLYLTRLTAIGR
jgi:hypothetical protein